MEKFDQKCIELLVEAPSAHSRYCFRSAFRHLELASTLIDVDPAMAIFRSITAEEEAASGLMRCLQELKYPCSESLNPHNHVHKHAVFPFLTVIRLFFSETLSPHVANYRLHIQEVEGTHRLMTAFPVPLSGGEVWGHPIPPLNFAVSCKDQPSIPSYVDQINSFVTAKGASSIASYLKKEANLRNEILYASPSGYPQIQKLDPAFIEERRLRVIAMLRLYLLIFPYPEHQPYVADALTSFVTMLVGLKKQKSIAGEA